MTINASAKEDAARLLEMINANWLTQAVGVAAQLGIADVLAGGAQDADTLASAVGCSAASLRRLLRALTSLEICTEHADGRYEMTALGSLLGSAAHPSVRSWAIWTSQCQWNIWGELLHSLKTGESARKRITGRTGYGHVVEDAEMAAVFYRAMIDLTQLIADAVACGRDWSTAKRLVDVGGGHGELLAVVLQAHPHLQGVLFDLPHAVEGARSKLHDTGLAQRCEVVGGSFFEAVPAGADVYMLKSILHNWSDEDGNAILRQCRRAVVRDGRLLVVERVMPDKITGSAVEQSVIRSDLNMMVGFGSRERTQAEFGALLAAANFELQRCDSVGFGFHLIEAAPR
jgi:orsellinic acid C2-O-methyltransferase